MKMIKMVKVSFDTWKKLAQMKLDCSYSSMDELLRDLLRDAGYYYDYWYLRRF